MEEDTPICLATFSTEMDAVLARMRLESVGIFSFLSKDDCGGMRPWLQPVTGVRLMVRRADAEQALEVLEDAPDEGE